MKTIKLLGSKPRSHPLPLVSWLIRLFELSSISHVGILFCDENKVFNAYFNNIDFMDLAEYTTRNNIRITETINISDDQYRTLQDFRNSKTGKQAGYFNTLIGAMVPQIIRNITFNTFRSIPNLAIGKKGITCSILARDCIEELGMPGSLLIDKKIDRLNYTTKDAVKLYEKLSRLNN